MQFSKSPSTDFLIGEPIGKASIDLCNKTLIAFASFTSKERAWSGIWFEIPDRKALTAVAFDLLGIFPLMLQTIQLLTESVASCFHITMYGECEERKNNEKDEKK